jgi:N-acyl-D-aspartate/D-glutamate deacylase
VKTPSRSRRWIQPEPGDTLESIAARELPALEPAEALRALQSWNLHLLLRPFPRGSLIGADVVYLEPPIPSQRSLLFITLPSWYTVVSLATCADKLAAFRDPELKRRLIAEATLPPEIAAAAGRDWESTFVRKVAHERNRALEGRRLGEIAAERGTTPLEVMIDLSVDEGLETWFLRSRIGHCDDAAVGAMLAHPYVHVGAGDGGAHVASFATYGDTGYLFSRFVRQTPALRLEAAVKKLSFDPCSIWGLAGRGLLRPGYKADVVVFDPERIDRGPEIEARDLPGAGIRWVRHAEGIDSVLVNGTLAWSSDGGYSGARTGEIAS